MKRLLVVFVLFTALFWSGCSDGKIEPSDRSLKVVTSFYPLAEIARKVGGDFVDVKNLVPAGSEPHDYEPSPQDMVNLSQADLVLINGLGLEHWTGKILPELQKDGVKTLTLSDALTSDLLDHDPHVWLAPVLYQKEVRVVAQKFGDIDPAHRIEYEKNAEKFVQDLQNLHQSFEAGLKNCRQKSFVTNHAAFGYLAHRYGLTMIPVSGLSPDAEPSAKTLADLVGLVRQKNIRYILTESFVNPKIAETLASEAGAKTLVLNPLEGLTKEELSRGENYISVMKTNLQNLRTAMECR